MLNVLGNGIACLINGINNAAITSTPSHTAKDFARTVKCFDFRVITLVNENPMPEDNAIHSAVFLGSGNEAAPSEADNHYATKISTFF